MLFGSEGSGGTVDDAHWFAEASARAYGDRANPAAEALSEFRARTLMGEATAQAHTPFAPAQGVKVLPGEPGAAGFVVGDSDGSFTACSLTMGQAFGAGRMGRTSGIALASSQSGGLPEFLAPALATRDGVDGVSLAVAATGVGGPAALAQLLRGVDSGTLTANIAAPRLVQPGAPDEVWAEPAMVAEVSAGLVARGHTVRVAPALGMTAAVACEPVARGEGRSCTFARDPRGFGVAAAARVPGW